MLTFGLLETNAVSFFKNLEEVKFLMRLARRKMCRTNRVVINTNTVVLLPVAFSSLVARS